MLNRGLSQANLVAAQMYDAVWLYAKSVEEAVQRNSGIGNGRELVESMAHMEWTGIN